MACIGLIKMNFGAIALFVQFIKVIWKCCHPNTGAAKQADPDHWKDLLSVHLKLYSNWIVSYFGAHEKLPKNRCNRLPYCK